MKLARSLLLLAFFSLLPLLQSHASGVESPFATAQQEFLPVEEAYRASLAIEGKKLAFTWEMVDGYFLYRHAFAVEVLADGTLRKLDFSMPPGEEKDDEFFGKVQVYHQLITGTLPLPSTNRPFRVKLTSQGCADGGLCYPPYSLYFSVNPLSGESNPIAEPDFSPAAEPSPATETPPPSLAWVLLGALIGGLILNLMPCVFPVLSIKVMQLSRPHDNSATRLHAMAYLFGIIATFVGIAGLMLALRAGGDAIGWGFQLQNPWFVALLTYLFFVLGLGMSGALTIGQQWMGVGQSLTEKGGVTGTFFTGVLAVVVASPCTAPFMGTALGYALTQSTPVALLVFATLGVGMALPLVAASFLPTVGRWLPKPGLWMERLKQFLAFPLYVTAAWLLWILGNQTSTTGMLVILLGAIAIPLAFWFFQSGRAIWRLAGIVVLFGALSLPFSSQLNTPPQESVAAQRMAFSQQALKELRREGKPVLVNLTADWCITCLANEKTTLGRQEVQKALYDAGVIYMVGDWTDYNPEITTLLEQYGRSGIPLYLLFPPVADAPPIILPQLLTPQIVLDSIAAQHSTTEP